MRVAGSRDPGSLPPRPGERQQAALGRQQQEIAVRQRGHRRAEAAHAPVGARQAGSQQTKGALLFKLGRGHPPPQIVMPQQAAGQRLPLLDKIGADLRQPLFYRRQQAGDMNMQLVLRAAIFRVDRQ